MQSTTWRGTPATPTAWPLSPRCLERHAAPWRVHGSGACCSGGGVNDVAQGCDPSTLITWQHRPLWCGRLYVALTAWHPVSLGTTQQAQLVTRLLPTPAAREERAVLGHTRRQEHGHAVDARAGEAAAAAASQRRMPAPPPGASQAFLAPAAAAACCCPPLLPCQCQPGS